MSARSPAIVKHVWNYLNVLRNDIESVVEVGLVRTGRLWQSVLRPRLRGGYDA
jgi:hypothetical protein